MLRREDGATAIIVALCLLVIFGAGAIAIDLGSAWETKRDLVVDTDAAALAGARALATGDCSDAESAAEGFLGSNSGDTSVDLTSGVDFDCDPVAGTVRVDGSQLSQQTLSGAIGREAIDVGASSTAKVTDGAPTGGLRPFSVCMTDPAISSWIAGGAGTVHRLDISKTWHSKAEDNCQGGAPGNWGYVCYQKGKYNAGSCSANSLADMVLNGYDGIVDLEDTTPTDGDCDADTAAAEECDPITGSPNSSGFKDALATVECSPTTTPVASDCAHQFSVLGINSFTGNGSGAAIHPTHFVGVVLRGWNIHGSGGYLDFELVNMFEDGTSAVLSEGTLTELTAVMCSADHVADYCS